MDPASNLAALAFKLTQQDWNDLGLESSDVKVAATSNVDDILQRLVALLLVRIVAIVAQPRDYKDFSTTAICRTVLLNGGQPRWPSAITKAVVDQLREFVRRILHGYGQRPYHNVEHAYHVTLSVNKMLDIILNTEQNQNMAYQPRRSYQRRLPMTFGLKSDTLMQFALLFAALIHDVKHVGVSNRQLSLEEDPIALLYNDLSVLENQSLTVAFSELLKAEFELLRITIFSSREEYIRFRKTVVGLVLTTDIASPERMQITKDKWKAAFGENSIPGHGHASSMESEIDIRKSSSNASKGNKRRSIGSVFSEITLDNAATASDDEVSHSITPESSDSEHAIDDGLLDEVIMSSVTLGLSEDAEEPHTPLEQVPEDQASRSPSITSHDLGYSPAQAASSIPDRSNRPHPATNEYAGSVHRLARFARNRRGSCTSVPEDCTTQQPTNAHYERHGAQQRGRNSYRRASIATGEVVLRMQRRMSTSSSACDSASARRFRAQRLGILRSVDLSGETIENYSRGSSTRTVTSGNPVPGNREREWNDEPDELRATVVMETIIVAADVAHNLQGWNQMLKWSSKLYTELETANHAGRGFDPKPNWKESQIGFLQGYVMPLAIKLRDTGVFGDLVGPSFADVVQKNIERWEAEGADITATLIHDNE